MEKKKTEMTKNEQTMDFYTGSEFYDAVQNGDIQTISTRAAEILRKLFDAWLDERNDTFPALLEKCIQKTKIAGSYLDSTENSPEYQIGKLYGAVQVFALLYQEEKDLAAISEQMDLMLQKNGPAVLNVFSTLSELDNTHEWACCEVIAQRTGVPVATLEEIMLRLTAARAADIRENANSAKYRITQLGKRWYEKTEMKTKEEKQMECAERYLGRLYSLRENDPELARKEAIRELTAMGLLAETGEPRTPVVTRP